MAHGASVRLCLEKSLKIKPLKAVVIFLLVKFQVFEELVQNACSSFQGTRGRLRHEKLFGLKKLGRLFIIR
jgi:hypothetical protein